MRATSPAHLILIHLLTVIMFFCLRKSIRYVQQTNSVIQKTHSTKLSVHWFTEFIRYSPQGVYKYDFRRIRVIRSGKMRWAGQVAQMGEMRNAYKNFRRIFWREETISET
jgi:hypothetical protein